MSDLTTPVRSLDVPTTDGCRVLSQPDLGYADGAESRLLEIVRAAEDLSSSSQRLADEATDWGTTYSLVPTRSNVVRALDLPADARVLEIGCGCGPITRYLGETCALVDSVEPMPARAAVARARTRDLDNVEIFVGTLDDVPAEPAYDVVVVIGVLEYVGQGALSEQPYLSFLRQCHAVLREGGTLVVAIENPLGVKYISGAVEDHTNRPFDSLEGYALESPARTFPRRVLEGMFAATGFASEFLAAFPDYKLPRAVMSDALFRSSDQLVGALPRFPSPDYLVPRLQLSDEKLTWRTLVESGVAEHFANSFIALARKGDGPTLWSPARKAVLFASDRQPEFAVRSEVCEADGELHFVRRPLYADRAVIGEKDGIRHLPAEREPVVTGRELLQVLLDEPGRRSELLRRWVEMVPDEEWAPVDLVPHNLVLTADGLLSAIDQEWQVRGYDRDVLLLRGLFLTAVQLATRTRPERLRPHTTIGELVAGLAAEAGVEVTDALIDRFCADEAAFQGVVNTTDRTGDERRHRSATELRSMFALSLSDARGGERFDVQWERARAEIDQLNVMVKEHDELAEARQKAVERDLEHYREAHDALRAEYDALLAARPSAVAKRVVGGALSRARALRRR
jgi:SAM-dependent methyltransferase